MVLCVVSMFFLPAPLCGAREKDGIDHLVSLDLSYSLTGLLNQGWGMGLGGEKKIAGWLSVKGTFGHMTFLTGIDDVYCTSAHISMFLNYYPLSKGLDKLYISIGNGCDFMHYFGGGDLPDPPEDTLIHLTPKLGWKVLVRPWLMLDISAGYKFIIAGSENYRNIRDYTDTGFQFGLGFKIFLNKAGKERGDE
jgi:hypothetical protein